MMQFFHWYTAGDGTQWNEAAARAKELAKAGFTGVWLPPAYKGTGASDVGYGVYDMYDLGEFDQKGSVRTKYGHAAEYLAAVKALQKAGPAGLRRHRAQPADGRGRDRGRARDALPAGRPPAPEGEPREIECYTRFSFPRPARASTRVELPALRRGRLRPPQPGREEHRSYLLEGKQFDDQVASSRTATSPT